MHSTPEGPYNCFVHFISSNPVTSFNPTAVQPTIEAGAFVGPFSSVIGDATLKSDVFVAPNVSIRADEGSPFYIGEGSNLQDGVILHGLKEGRVRVYDRDYSIYIDRGVSITHGAIIHGPAYVGERSFVGFQSLVYQAIVGSHVFISNNAIVTGKIIIANDRFVPPGSVIDTQKKADQLPPIPDDEAEFAQIVQSVNKEFAASYSLMFGNKRCSCGLAYNL